MIADDLVVWQTAEHRTCSRHRKYALSCDQFDMLLERAAGRCELCGLEGSASAWGVLHIDHEHQVGWWAVRGLLCDGCNSRLQYARRLPSTPPLRRYLENAWYRQEMERLGLSAELPPEPGVGSSVKTSTKSWIRLDGDVEQSWAHRRGRFCTLNSWRGIWYDHGPLCVQVTQGRDEFPQWERSFYRDGFDVIKAAKKRAKASPSTDGDGAL